MMADETKDLMVTLIGMTKGELVDVIDRLNDDLQTSIMKAIDERDDALGQIEELKKKNNDLFLIANRWENEYKNLFDLVSAGATIKEGVLVYDESIKAKAKELSPAKRIGSLAKYNPKQRLYGVMTYEQLKAKGDIK